MTLNNLLFSLAVISTGFIAALILTGKVKTILLKRAVLDIPNDRSSHKIPVPRGGGWALLAVLLPALLSAAVYIDQDLRHAGLIAGVVLLAGISWLDDRKHVGAAVRLGLHLAAAYLGSLCFAPHAEIFNGMLPFWCDRALMIIGWGWFINLYNFMDGIDGITGVETVSIATGLCLVLSAAGIVDPYVDFLTLVLTGSCLGFLAYNWHPAKIFLGDVGSVPLGYLTGFCLIALAVQGHIIPALILPAYYLADSGLTITKRALRGEKIWQAHREHFYQKSALGYGRHDKTVWLIILVNIALIAAAMSGVKHPWAALAATMAIVAVLLGKMHKSGVKDTEKTT